MFYSLHTICADSVVERGTGQYTNSNVEYRESKQKLFWKTLILTSSPKQMCNWV
jgi:hypothetical protein